MTVKEVRVFLKPFGDKDEVVFKDGTGFVYSLKAGGSAIEGDKELAILTKK